MKRKASPGVSSPAAARKRGAGAGGAASAKSFFTGATVLLVEDGMENGITAKRAELFISRIKALGGSVDLIKAARITQGNRLSAEERDKRLLHVTHVVTGLRALGTRGVLEGLHLAPTAQPAFKVVGPEWVSACFLQQKLVEATAEYALPVEPPEAADATTAAPTTPLSPDSKKRPRPSTGAAGASSSSAHASSPSPSKGGGPQLAPPPRTRAEIEAILARDFPPEMDTATREAYIAYGGPLDIRTGRDMPRFACQRPAPRLHPNAALTGVFEEIQELYNATGDKERETSFGRALGVLRAWPRRIKSSAEIKGAYHIGASMLKEVDQILATGTSERLEALKKEPRNLGLRDLFRLHQVGSATAAKWYGSGYHSVAQILAEIDAVPEGGDPTETRFYQTIKPSHEQWMGVLHFRDYSQKMTRAQVAALEALVKEAALTVLQLRGMGPETLLLATCGGYRRGKEWNGDADVLVSCTQAEGQRELREAVKKVMRDEMGLDLIVLKEGGAVQGFPTNKPHERLESHDNMLMLIKHEDLYRRLDIICPPPDQWAACVLGWSGTKQMEKDLRDYADSIGLYLSQQAVYKGPNRLPNPKSPDGIFHREEDIWEFIGLKFLPPLLRWA